MLRALTSLLCFMACTGEFVVPEPKVPECGEAPRFHRLSAPQYQAVVTQLLPEWAGLKTLATPFSHARRADVFSTWSSQASISGYEVDDVWTAADVIATEWTERQKELCPSAGRTLECLRRVYGPALSLLTSRTPSDETLGELAVSLNEAERELPPRLAVVATMRTLLMSPEFLFRSERGVEGRLQSSEVAAALSFTLWEAPPDTMLRGLADADALTTTEAVQGQAHRLLERPADVPALRRFLREFLQYENATNTFKDVASFPFHRPNELIDDTEHVVERLVNEHARSGLHRKLLTSELVYVRPSTAKSWGLTLTGDAGVFVTDPTRSGVLTHPSWLVALSEPDHNHLVRRGRFVRERLLCGEVPMLPGGVVPQIDRKPGLTLPQRIAQHSADPSCSGCHQLMDPLGMGFEAWDHVGRAQTMDNGGVVSTRGSLEGAGAVDGPYTDAKQLMTRLAESPTVKACWVKQLFRFVRGRDAKPSDRCELERLTQTYDETSEDTLAVIEALFASDDFLQRKQVTP